MKKKVILFMLVLICIVALCGCDNEDINKFSKDGKIQLNISLDYLAIKDVVQLVPKTIDKSAKIKWSVDKPLVAKVDDNGLVEAVSVGECKISAALPNGNSTSCKITVSDSIVSNSYKEGMQGFGETRFDSIQKATDKGGTVVVMKGTYPEYVVAKEVKIIAVNSVSMIGIEGEILDVKGVSFSQDTFVENNKATVSATKQLKLSGCSFAINVVVDKVEYLTGGYAIYCPTTVSEVSIVRCSIMNYRYGIYLERTAANIDISNNTFSTCYVGMGVNVINPNNILENYSTTGAIYNNILQECYKPTEFIFVGGIYRGDLRFSDNVLSK